MNKAKFKEEIKKVNFSELKKADGKLYPKLKEFTQAVIPEVVGKQSAPEGKKPHTGEFPKEVEQELDTLFAGLKQDYPQVFKGYKKKVEKTPLEKKLNAFKIALSLTENEADRKILNKKITAFEIALSVEKGI